MTTSPLSPEIVSLIHHLELNKSGWWDLATEKLILVVLWQANRTLTEAELLASLRDSYSLQLIPLTLKNRLHALQSRREVISQADGTFKLAEAARKSLEIQVIEAKELAARLRVHAASLIPSDVSNALREGTWDYLYDHVLAPWIRSAGAYAYRLLAGPNGPVRAASVATQIETFLSRYPTGAQEAVRAAVEGWLSSDDPDLRKIVLQTLNSHFVLEASRLDDATLSALTPTGSARPSFGLFIDTNLLFSLLGLHDNPANEAAESLLDVIRELRGRVNVKLYVLATTIDETKRAITARLGPLRNLRLGPNLSVAATDVLHGIDRRFADECKKAGVALSPDDFFGPYLNNLLPVLKTKDINLFNTPLQGYSVRSDVVDDINDALERETSKPAERRKGYEQIAHDMILWHFVKDRRPAVTESPLDAVSWVATIDLGLLGFDEYRCHREKSKVPVCIYPTTLVQMLQFWVPRSPAFDAALFGSLGLPALFHDFDPETESVTVRILRALSRFENIDYLPPETVRAILVNESLRQRLTSETTVTREVELVREALIEENRKKQAALDAEKVERARVTDELLKSSARVAELESTARAHGEEAETAKAALRNQVRKSRDADDRISALEDTVRRNVAERDREAAGHTARRFLLGSLLLLVPIVVLFTYLLGAYAYAFRLTPLESGLLCAGFSALTWTECFLLIGNRLRAVREERAFQFVRSHRIKVWAVLGAIAIGVAANNATDWIKAKHALVQGA